MTLLDPYSRKTTRGFAWNQGLALGRVHTWSDWLEEAFKTELASLVTNSGPGGDDDQTRRVPGDRDLARAGEQVVLPQVLPSFLVDGSGLARVHEEDKAPLNELLEHKGPPLGGCEFGVASDITPTSHPRLGPARLAWNPGILGLPECASGQSAARGVLWICYTATWEGSPGQHSVSE